MVTAWKTWGGSVRDWRFGQHQNPVGGFGHREDFFAGYEDASGRKVDPKVVHFWEVMGSLKWGIGCMFQAYKPYRDWWIPSNI